eukprot:GHRQ01030949.1.p2 GENE.GHRQ01030949.1~~GHRQ01030949.1.p2  ORF type:complete len:184 (+),score=48.09 GHRQ01030949.1:1075-1626(+)
MQCSSHHPAPFTTFNTTLTTTCSTRRPGCCSLDSDKERGRGDNAVWATDGSGGVGLTSAHAPDIINIKYAYDLVLNTTASNAQVFEHVGRPAVAPVVQGVSGTVFAYGVTSSGKTHTMMGTPADPGVVPRAIAVLFEMISHTPDRVFTVTCSMMEIYCEMLNDLLDPSKLNLDVQVWLARARM